MNAPLRTMAALLLLAMLPLPATAGEPDFNTPQRALRWYVEKARRGDYEAASLAFDLRQLPPAERPDLGPKLARQLKFVLDEQLWIDWDKVSNEPQGDPTDGDNVDVVGIVEAAGGSVPIRMRRDPTGEWRLGPSTVAAIPELYRTHGPGWLGQHLPAVLFDLRLFEIQAWQWLGLLFAILSALLVALGIGALGRRLLLGIVRRTRFTWDDELVEAASGPGRLLLGVAAFALALQALHLAVPVREAMGTLMHTLVIVSLVWAALRGAGFVAHVIDERLVQGAPDPLAARGAKTQIMVLRRVAGVVIIVIGSALILMQFQGMRALGTSLLASAGVAGIVIGLAAQRSIAMLLAGIQLSMTQPIRVGDVVIVEGEWGNIEEITLTYVVVKIWDLRRLVVPITKFLEAPFQNWTRASAEILGTVFLHADYAVPVDELRREVERFVRTRPEWDGKVAGLQVTDARERTVELRALVSAADSSKAWDLRCALREHLVGFLQRLEHGRYLPRARIEAPVAPLEPAMLATAGDAVGFPSPGHRG